MFLRLNQDIIPGLNKVLLGLHGLREERKANDADAAVVVTKNSVSGDRGVNLFPS